LIHFYKRTAISYSFRVMGVGKDDNVTLERKSFIDFELGDSAKEDAEDTSLTEKKQIIDAIGSWGRWQTQRFSLVILIIWLPTSFHLLNMVFYRAETDFWCSRPERFANWSVESWRNLSSPGWNSPNASIKNEASCNILDLDYEQIDEKQDFSLLHSAKLETIPCTSWEYDTSFWKRTIIMDFDLVCSKVHLRKLQQQVTFLGLMLGVSLAGFISDRFGRKKTMVLLLTAIILSGFANRFAPNYPAFLIGVFLCAFMSLAYGTVMYVWMMEHCDGKIKTVLGACPHYNFGFWGLMTALIAYLVPDWRDMQLIFSVPLVLLYSAYWVFPESSRWLLANGRVEEAEDIVREIARTNGRVLPAQWRLLPPSKRSNSDGSEDVGSATSFFRLFTMPNMRRKTFICYYLWFSTALIYYGLTLNSNTLSTDLFTTFTIGKALEFPSITLVIFLLIKAGRRLTLILFYTMAGVSLTGTIFIPLGVFPYEWPILVMNILGRISAINTLAVCYIYSAEVFPTVVRNIGLGSSSFWARVGPMIAPFIVDLKVYGAQVPLAIFGVISLLAALLVTFMPETSNTPLPDTIKEGEDLGKGDTFWSSIFRRRKKNTASD